MVAGLVPMETGVVTIDGSPPRAGRNDIAYMLARDCLFPWLTAQDNAELGNAMRDMPKAERRERAVALLAAVGLRDFAKAFPKELSHGMRQRVALARTFCMPSPVLLMDEPFGALDAQTKLQLEDLLLSLWSRERRSVLFITHDLSEAVVLSDRVIVMSARPGRIIADIRIPLERPRSVRSLQKDPRYHELYAEIWEKLESGLETAAAV
jgi:NitT/TauT family transport system ATP-binding protein